MIWRYLNYIAHYTLKYTYALFKFLLKTKISIKKIYKEHNMCI